MVAVASQIASLTTVSSTVYSDADRRKHQSSTSLAFLWGIHRGPVNSPHKWPVTRKMCPFNDVILINIYCRFVCHTSPLNAETLQIVKFVFEGLQLCFYEANAPSTTILTPFGLNNPRPRASRIITTTHKITFVHSHLLLWQVIMLFAELMAGISEWFATVMHKQYLVEVKDGFLMCFVISLHHLSVGNIMDPIEKREPAAEIIYRLVRLTFKPWLWKVNQLGILPLLMCAHTWDNIG